jgi:hypothetical protein
MVRILPQFHLAMLLLPLALAGAHAEDAQGFSDGPNGAMVHVPSGFICPLKIGPFERDATGRRDPDRDSDYCAYSALSGVYGTIIITPLGRTFDPKEGLADEFPDSGGTVVGETVQPVGTPAASLPVYLRTYETARLESLHYRTLFADAAVGAWSVAVIVEFADPRDREAQTAFLNSVYAAALRELGGAPLSGNLQVR